MANFYPVRVLMSRSYSVWIFVLLGIVYCLICGDIARKQTPTVDEFAHMPAGLSYWRHGTLSLYSKNPPLLKYLLTLPQAFSEEVIVPVPTEGSLGWGPWFYGKRFMEANKGRYFEVFFSCRLVNILLGLAAGLLIFLWTKRLFGPNAAVAASIFYFFSPTILAHSSLATLDIGCMLTVLATLFCLAGVYQAGGKPYFRLLGCGVVFGLALVSKFTAILLSPLILIYFFLQRVWRGQAKLAILDVIFFGIAALFTINAVYGFMGSFARVDAYAFQSSFMKAFFALIPAWLPLPLPADFLAGFDAQKLDTETGEFGSYLFGQWSTLGWWYYHPLALLMKSPLLWLLSLLLIPLAWRKWSIAGSDKFLLLVPAVFLAIVFSASNHLNIGVRYLLPIIPFLTILSGGVVSYVIGLAKNRGAPILILGFLLLYHVEILRKGHPDYIGFFNLASGGPENGANLMIDSNLDWGQDLYRVRDYLAQRKYEQPIRLLYFGHVAPELYGLKFHLMPEESSSGLIAVSVNFLKGYSYLAPGEDGNWHSIGPEHTAWLSAYQPIAKLGSIWVFNIEKPLAP
jgi:hypothetical protein